jgi:mono/diheme cytochrome c family protein
MTTDVANGSSHAAPAVLGALTGVIAFLSLILWFGMPVIPNTDGLPTILKDKPSPYASLAAPAGPTDPGEQTYQTVCAACHQATGQGLPGAFPPLAGSEWVNGDPETMIRIVIAGLSGPITVKGQAFTSLMPPPPGLDDEKIAAVLTYVRSHFDNKASKVDKAQVAAVRSAIASRNKPWTADELKALAKPGEGGAKAGDAAPAGAAPAGAAPTGTTPGAPGATPAPPAAEPTPKGIAPVTPTVGPARSATAVPKGTNPSAPK